MDEEQTKAAEAAGKGEGGSGEDKPKARPKPRTAPVKKGVPAVGDAKAKPAADADAPKAKGAAKTGDGKAGGKTAPKASPKAAPKGASDVSPKTAAKAAPKAESKAAQKPASTGAPAKWLKRKLKGKKVHLAPLALSGVCVLAAAVIGICCALGSCAGDPALETGDLSGGVAAVVGETQIGENAITSNIEQFRAASGLESDEAWGTYLAERGETPETLRASTLSTYVYQELVRQAAAQQGVEVSAADVDAAVSAARQSAGSDEAWRQSLADAGMSEQAYRSNTESSLLQKALVTKVAGDVSASDEDVLDYIATYTLDYKDATSLSAIPDDVVQRYREVCDQSRQSKVLGDWMADFEKDVNVETHDMPQGLSYAIDMTPYE